MVQYTCISIGNVLYWITNMANQFTVEYLEECFHYLKTGVIVWKKRPRTHFTSKRNQDAWNNKHVDKDIAAIGPSGWIMVHLNSRAYVAVNLIYQMLTGKDVMVTVKNSCRADMRMENLTEYKGRMAGFSRYTCGHPLYIEKEDVNPNEEVDLQRYRYGVRSQNHVFIYHSSPLQAMNSVQELSIKLNTIITTVPEECKPYGVEYE